MFFSKNNSKLNNNANIELTINDVALEQVKSLKFLGVMLNDKLNWKDHKNYVRNKISRNLGILYKCRNIMKIEDLINMYN